jgi:hypothetical protein
MWTGRVDEGLDVECYYGARSDAIYILLAEVLEGIKSLRKGFLVFRMVVLLQRTL